MEGEKSGLKIWMLIEHRDQEMSHSMYLIEPPLVEEEMDSDGFAVDSISPIKTIEEKQGDCCIISECGMFRVGSRFYNLGGRSIYDWYMCKWKPPLISNELKLRVQFFDIDHPELGFQRAASLNAPKEAPCVFSVCGRIYALGSRVRDCNLGGGHKGRGIFERYDPDEDCWTVLPDPPKPFGEAAEILWCDSATVVRDRYIYVGNTAHQLYLVFDLEDEQWAYLPHSSSLFPYGSLYVDDSLYYLTGIGSWKPGTQFDDDTLNYYAADDDNKVRLVKRGPLPLVDDPVKFINSMPVDEHVMSTFTQLEGDTWFTEIDYMQWRDIFHLGGRFFCYVVTAHLTNDINPLLPSQLYCRGVWIKVFEEVLPNSNSTTKLPHFRTLASFSYRIRTPFINNGYLIRCSAFGSVPDSWVKAPLKKNQVAAKGREALKAEQSQHEYGGGSEGQRDNSLDKLLAARDEEYSRLKAELAEKDKLLREKDKLLKDYESFLAKNKGKSVLIVLYQLKDFNSSERLASWIECLHLFGVTLNVVFSTFKLNKQVWSRGVRSVPRRVRVRIARKRNIDEDAKEELYSEEDP